MTQEQQPLRIDIETYSSVPFGGKDSHGLYKYVNAPDFEILIFGYSWGDGPVTVLDLAGDYESIPDHIVDAIKSPLVIKKAFNAMFERVCLSVHLGVPMLNADCWECTMIKAYMHGLPADLARAAIAVGGKEKKDPMGKKLIKYFSNPNKDSEGHFYRNYPTANWDWWEQYKDYNMQDVKAEAEVDEKLTGNPMNNFERVVWAVDQDINDRGVAVDLDLVEAAMLMDERYTAEMESTFFAITGLSKAKGPQFKAWLTNRGFEVDGINKETRAGLLRQAVNMEDDAAAEALRIEIELSKTSVTKYKKMLDCAVLHSDGVWRLHGLLQYYGANRTGRWAGRLVQVQNLPKAYMSFESLDAARRLVKDRDYDTLSLLFDSVSTVLSELIRTAFVPSPGKVFKVCDYSAIEARGLAWVAGEQWRLEVFAGNGKIYEESAARTFNVPVESITKESPLRQQGKVTELALGYGGSSGAIDKMDSKKAIPEEDRPAIVKKWRAANKNIVKFWYDVDDAAMAAVIDRKTVQLQHGITFFMKGVDLYIQLPSGRNLVYHKAHIGGPNKFGNDEIRYYNIDSTNKWTITSTYGAKLVENIIQALCRDALAVAITRLESEGHFIVMHVHDEVVVETDIEGGVSLEEIAAIMAKPISWAPGLLLPAEGYETAYYRKD